MDVIGTYKKVNANHILHASNNPDNSYMPIPIQPSILEKAGFEWETSKKTHMSIRMSRVDLYFYYKDGVMDEFQIYQNTSLVSLPPIKYVHQLQNLYYSLVGCELPLNL